MKKSTVIIVTITFVLSVVLVGIFGMQMMSYNTRIYVEKITPTAIISSTGETAEILHSEDREGNELPDDYYAVLHYVEGLVVRIDYEVTPADATDNRVELKINNLAEDNPQAELDGMNINILRTGSLRLNFRASDGTGTEITFVLYIRPQPTE